MTDDIACATGTPCPDAADFSTSRMLLFVSRIDPWLAPDHCSINIGYMRSVVSHYDRRHPIISVTPCILCKHYEMNHNEKYVYINQQQS